MLNSSSNLDQVLSNLRMMDFEKNKMKRELGNQKDVLISENFDANSVWQTVSIKSEHLAGEGVKREAHVTSNDVKILEKENIILRGKLKNAERRLLKLEESLKRDSPITMRGLDILELEVNEVAK